ncbi:MAG TPA: RloB family protein [bacterium]|nr:MAG: hypothetical protein BWY28_01097 [bacterium ADurb.Bin236]HOY62439.1 RloB family protein [bacterium]HPI75609.1 RloB family protein [bacterium]HPN93987.1 RloB family protein [bacterium]
MSAKKYRKKKKLARKPPFKELKPVLLIVCEGKKTEPYYFEDIKSKWKITSMQIEIKGSNVCGTAPKDIVDYAKKEWKKKTRDGMPIEKGDVWCVFDRDAHESFDAAIKMAKDNGFGIAVSNPCFELWYLLHFRNQTAHIERDDVKRSLREHIIGYESNMKEVFSEINDKMEKAEKHAHGLRLKHEGDGSPETQNPSTGVDALIKRLRDIREPEEERGSC